MNEPRKRSRDSRGSNALSVVDLEGRLEPREVFQRLVLVFAFLRWRELRKRRDTPAFARKVSLRLGESDKFGSVSTHLRMQGQLRSVYERVYTTHFRKSSTCWRRETSVASRL